MQMQKVKDYMNKNSEKLVQDYRGKWYVLDNEGHNALYNETFETEAEALESYETFLQEEKLI
jgi:hypothetical protein